MNIRQLRAYVEETKSLAFKAMAYVSRNSRYYKLCRQMTSGEIKAGDFPKLRTYLVKNHAR